MHATRAIGRFGVAFATLATLATLGLGACATFGRGPVAPSAAGEGSAKAGTPWRVAFSSSTAGLGDATLAGWASMTAGARRATTDVTLRLSHASPETSHPWQLHHGRCGADEGVFGPASAYTPLTADAQGNGSGQATVQMPLPTEGPFFVRVAASAASPETTIACGDLVLPTP